MYCSCRGKPFETPSLVCFSRTASSEDRGFPCSWAPLHSIRGASCGKSSNPERFGATHLDADNEGYLVRIHLLCLHHNSYYQRAMSKHVSASIYRNCAPLLEFTGMDQKQNTWSPSLLTGLGFSYPKLVAAFFMALTIGGGPHIRSFMSFAGPGSFVYARISSSAP